MIPRRYPGLDLLRAIAIGLVLVSHASLILELGRLPWSGAKYCGPLGVDLFFALSGFLIGGILIDTGERMERPRVLAGFWLSRWIRTLPNYYLFLAVNVALWAWVYVHPRVPWEDVRHSAIFCQNLTHAPTWFFMESWSLSVEEWFYLLLPLGLWLGLLSGLRFRWALAAMLVLMFAEPLLRRTLTTVHRDWGFEINLIVFNRMDALGWGVAAAWLARAQPAAWQRWSRLLFWAGIALIGECLAFTQRPDFNLHWFSRILFPLAQPLGCALLLPAMSTWTGWRAGPLNAATSAMARWSYSLYLINTNVSILVITDLQGRLGNTWRGVALSIAVFVGLSVCLAALIYRWFEAPILRLRDRVPLCREAAAARQSALLPVVQEGQAATANA